MENLRTRAWWAIRKHKSITLVDLLTEVCDGSEKNPKANLSMWLKALAAAGVISIEQVDDDKPTLRYALVLDLGAKAPIYRTVYERFFDPNSGFFINHEAS